MASVKQMSWYFLDFENQVIHIQRSTWFTAIHVNDLLLHVCLYYHKEDLVDYSSCCACINTDE